MKIVVIGGSAAGLFALLLLARAGHEVCVLEQDHLEPAPDVESAAGPAFRRAAPQIVQPHIVMARCRELLRERLPDVYRGVLAAGVAEAALSTQMPPSLADTAAWPDDERLTVLMTRRSTFDWVLQRTIRTERDVTRRAWQSFARRSSTLRLQRRRSARRTASPTDNCGRPRCSTRSRFALSGE